MVSPTDFPDTYKIDALSISYDNLMEISQGGPVVGRLLIDGEVFGNNLLFGGPFVIEKKRVYIPLFIRKFCVTGFKVCAINLESLSYELISPMEDVIFWITPITDFCITIIRWEGLMVNRSRFP